MRLSADFKPCAASLQLQLQTAWSPGNSVSPWETHVGELGPTHRTEKEQHADTPKAVWATEGLRPTGPLYGVKSYSHSPRTVPGLIRKKRN